jgi:arabinofuranosyltransferase
MSDDGYIVLRVVRQLVNGNGPVYNTGERVEAATSPLWVYLLATAKTICRPVDLAWLAVLLGLAGAVLSLALAQWAAYRLWRLDSRRIIVPAGAIVIAATPAFWDFATSGLETGLEFAWLSASFFATVTLLRGPGAGPFAQEEAARGLPAWVLVLVGLGPLVRPDFALFTVAFLAAAFVVRRPATKREWVRSLGIAFAAPLAYEIFRAGYYAQLAPNPAFAKEASLSRWDQGSIYLWDTLSTYWLLVPVGLTVLAAAPSLYLSALQRPAGVVIAAPVLAGLAHGLYTTYVGGDFMHARMLLPAIFALLLPVAVVRIDTVLSLLPLAGMAVWAFVCADTLRPSYEGIAANGIANERLYYIRAAGHPHPITAEDYRPYWEAGLDRIERAPPRSLLFRSEAPPVPIRDDIAHETIVVSEIIGIAGWVLGDNVYVLDTHGLAHSLGGRMEMGPRGRPGHEKTYQGWYIIADYTDPSYIPPNNEPPPIDIAQARIVLQCGDIPELREAVSGRITPGRFLKNVFVAIRLHGFRFSGNPFEATRQICAG